VIPSDFAGIFSRYFVIGFFLPFFFLLLAVAHIAEPSALPSAYRSAAAGTQVIIIGGASVFGALIFSGLNFHFLRTLEGYPFQRFAEGDKKSWLGPPRTAVEKIVDGRLEHWRRRWRDLSLVVVGPTSPDRTRAAERRDRDFPRCEADILPTRFGNALRAFEAHPMKRYGLDGVAAWPRIEVLLSESEQESLVEARTDVSLFVNLTFLGVPAGVYLAIAVLAGDGGCALPIRLVLAAACLAGGIAASFCAYMAAVGAVVRWGVPVRAAIDMHRLELYTKLGLRHPETFMDEARVAKAVNRSALYGEPFTTPVRAKSES
jgi:hypothetical protein